MRDEVVGLLYVGGDAMGLVQSCYVTMRLAHSIVVSIKEGFRLTMEKELCNIAVSCSGFGYGTIHGVYDHTLSLVMLI